MALRFQSFPVYQQIRIYIKDIYLLAKSLPKSEQYELASQLRRATTSILLNLAEGSMKKSNAELRRFLLISIGSVGEVVSILDICLDLKYIATTQHDNYVLKSESIIKQLYGFAKSLEKS